MKGRGGIPPEHPSFHITSNWGGCLPAPISSLPAWHACPMDAEFFQACYVLAIRATGGIDLANEIERMNW